MKYYCIIALFIFLKNTTNIILASLILTLTLRFVEVPWELSYHAVYVAPHEEAKEHRGRLDFGVGFMTQ